MPMIYNQKWIDSLLFNQFNSIPLSRNMHLLYKNTTKTLQIFHVSKKSQPFLKNQIIFPIILGRLAMDSEEAIVGRNKEIIKTIAQVKR